MRKQSSTAHPIVAFVGGGVIGLLCLAIFILLDKAISPFAESLLGSWWLLIEPLFFFSFVGLVCKVLLLQNIARTYRIEPMTPEAFAGLSLEKMQQPVRVAPPLPPVVPDESLPKPVKEPSGARALDWYGIENRTSELQELGFVLQIEGVPRTDRKATVPAFTRVFAHPSGAMAQVFQLFPRGRAPMPLTVSFATRFEDNWVVSDHTMNGNWLIWMLRLPRSLGKRHEATSLALEMWQAHRARCNHVADALGIRIAPFSLENFVALAETELRQMRALVLRRSALVAMIQARFFRPRNGEWWGDFEREAKKRKADGDVAIAQNG